MKYIIWYNASTRSYNWGDEMAYEMASSNSPDDSILAEEFTNTSVKIVEKITSKLNDNMILVQG